MDVPHVFWTCGFLRCVLERSRRYWSERVVRVVHDDGRILHSESCADAHHARMAAERLWDEFIEPTLEEAV